jgi:S1-C subfamily serine protease
VLKIEPKGALIADVTVHPPAAEAGIPERDVTLRVNKTSMAAMAVIAMRP